MQTMEVVEDCVVKYSIFPKIVKIPSSSLISDLEELLNDSLVKLSSLLTNYIWQNEPFNLRVVTETQDVPAHLEGSTNYGDNVEDEWFIVFLLLELSKTYPDIVLKCEDSSDGEFLLIEGADHLPKWLNPETSENRVFISSGQLHIIPLAQSPGQVTPLPSGVPHLKDAVEAIRSHPAVTKANEEIQKCVFSRVENYPGKAKTMQHRAQVYVPAGVATLLRHKPQLVASAINAFTHRDPIDLKACRAMKYFPPETRVQTLVTFTRCLYAQLHHQKFEPDRRVGWNLPPPKSPQFMSHSLGVKLACGFEILTSNAKNSDIQPDMDDLTSDRRWTKFIKSLNDKGYFKGELEGSRLHTQLLSDAKNYFLTSIQDSNDSNVSEGTRILALLRSLDLDYEAFKQAEKTLPKSESDSWLDLTPDQLESILQDYSGADSAQSSQNNGCEKEIASTITEGLKTFVDHKSGHEGAEIPKRKNKKNNSSADIQFESENFTEAVRSILDFKMPEYNGESSSSMSGYSDEEEEEELSAPVRPPRRKDTKLEAVEEMKSYMNQMDRELAETDVGLSFERETTAANKKADESIGGDNIDQETDDFKPVDIDLTVLKNILESFSSQQGLAGPASNLLQSMGIVLPDNTD